VRVDTRIRQTSRDQPACRPARTSQRRPAGTCQRGDQPGLASAQGQRATRLDWRDPAGPARPGWSVRDPAGLARQDGLPKLVRILRPEATKEWVGVLNKNPF
jgi:hypothetical protein